MDKQISDYQSSTLEDLINDESFMLWVSQPTEELDSKWNTIQQLYPGLAPIIREGKEIILSLHFETEVLHIKEQQNLWHTIAAKTTLNRKPQRKIRLWSRYAAAAILVGVLFLAGLLYSTFKQITVQTPYGQLKTLTLPDGSKVTLNANSKIKYDKNWDNDKIREVWVEGEAFLEVNHLHKNGPVKNHQRFIVHTGELNVEVLGTSFNVNDRRGRTEVALLKGKIRLALNTEKEKSLILAPGDIVEYIGGSLNKKPINVAEYTSWKDGKLYFNDVPVSTIFNYFEDIYGYKAKVSDTKILTRKLSGTISSRNEKVFLETVARTLNITITKDTDSHKLIIKAN
ncbi:transmembrane sensor [Pedobacter sp. UYP30]|uniref:FecR family protein n=1 Tax=Pedobacter sp. UYP30 TaxID=1756400 RepID=UPI0033977C7B